MREGISLSGIGDCLRITQSMPTSCWIGLVPTCRGDQVDEPLGVVPPTPCAAGLRVPPPVRRLRGSSVDRVHELSIAEAIAHKVRERGAGRSISAVTIRVGHFRQVVPDALQFSWTMVTDGTDLEGCKLEIEQVPATVNCRDCDSTTTLDIPILVCGSCGGSDVTLLTGEEFVIVSLEIQEV